VFDLVMAFEAVGRHEVDRAEGLVAQVADVGERAVGLAGLAMHAHRLT
jgi:hypothetical protein